MPRSLVRLMGDFPRRLSEILRDGVHFLISLSQEGYRITIDYNTPEEESFVQMITALGPSLCLCALAVLAETLSLRFSSTTRGLPMVAFALRVGPVDQTRSRWERSIIEQQNLFSKAIKPQISSLHDLCLATGDCLALIPHTTVLGLWIFEVEEASSFEPTLMHVLVSRHVDSTEHTVDTDTSYPSLTYIRLGLYAAIHLARTVGRIRCGKGSFMEPTCTGSWEGQGALLLESPAVTALYVKRQSMRQRC